MRTIKFRGQCTSDSQYAGEWVTGGVVICEKTNNVLIISAITDKVTCTYHVKSETVGQFTNLTDCEGNEIYDGDIIESGKGVRHVIKWNAERAAWGAFPPCGALPLWDSGDYGITQSWLIEFGKKVIGNIHDNKDLMQEYNKQIS